MAKPGRAARLKGLAFEREVARMFREIGFRGANRQLEFQQDQAQGIDIRGVDPYRVQCKKFKAYASVNTIDEIQHDREFGDVPILITAADGKEPMAVIPLAELLKLIKKTLQRVT